MTQFWVSDQKCFLISTEIAENKQFGLLNFNSDWRIILEICMKDLKTTSRVWIVKYYSVHDVLSMMQFSN